MGILELRYEIDCGLVKLGSVEKKGQLQPQPPALRLGTLGCTGVRRG